MLECCLASATKLLRVVLGVCDHGCGGAGLAAGGEQVAQLCERLPPIIGQDAVAQALQQRFHCSILRAYTCSSRPIEQGDLPSAS